MTALLLLNVVVIDTGTTRARFFKLLITRDVISRRTMQLLFKHGLRLNVLELGLDDIVTRSRTETVAPTTWLGGIV